MRRYLLFLVAVLLGVSPARADEAPWDTIREMLFEDRPVQDGAGLLALEAPARAVDAAVVPMRIRALRDQEGPDAIRTIWLVIDRNPAPVAAVFHFEPGLPSASVATRVRVNEFTPVRAIAETADGALWGVERFVKASGGCSAPALKNREEIMARLGKMKLRRAAPVDEAPTAQLLVSHPNYSGLQMDQATRFWIPPDYVRSIRIERAGRPLLAVEGDISLSEDPSITFALAPGETDPLTVAVDDSEGRQFSETFTLTGGS